MKVLPVVVVLMMLVGYVGIWILVLLKCVMRLSLLRVKMIFVL